MTLLFVDMNSAKKFLSAKNVNTSLQLLGAGLGVGGAIAATVATGGTAAAVVGLAAAILSFAKGKPHR